MKTIVGACVLGLIALNTSFVAGTNEGSTGAIQSKGSELPAVRVHIWKSVAHRDAWLDVGSRHSVGEDVSVDYNPVGMKDAIDVHIHSIKAQQYGGCRLTLHLSTNERGETVADAGGSWWTDRVARGKPSQGALTDVRGDIYLGAELKGASSPIKFKFHLTAGQESDPFLLMGAGVVVLKQ